MLYVTFFDENRFVFKNSLHRTVELNFDLGYLLSNPR